jgi:hypothetical protein
LAFIISVSEALNMWTEFVDELVNLGNSVQRGDLGVFKPFLSGATVNGIPAESRR